MSGADRGALEAAIVAAAWAIVVEDLVPGEAVERSPAELALVREMRRLIERRRLRAMQ